MSGAAWCTSITTIAWTRPVSVEPSARIRSMPSQNAADLGSWITARPFEPVALAHERVHHVDLHQRPGPDIGGCLR